MASSNSQCKPEAQQPARASSVGYKAARPEGSITRSVKRVSTGKGSVKRVSTGKGSVVKRVGTGRRSVKRVSTGKGSVKRVSTGKGSVKRVSTGKRSVKQSKRICGVHSSVMLA